ncbi:hypothetical protein ACFQH2_10140 [Natronoarchaeum sp. GCM10025703]|uniref:hypothetical protein n=1 Tax=unclassified Natronoarchaeum TaxID=2620183 RepID=UPI0036218A54
MRDLRIGKHGVAVLVAIFLILTIEDIFIWINSGIVPGIEFFIASLAVVVVFALAIRQSQKYDPPDS